MWVVLVLFNNYKQANVSQEAYRTYDEALAEMRKKELKQLTEYIFYDEDQEIKYELKNVYVK